MSSIVSSIGREPAAELNGRIALVVSEARQSRGWSAAVLAERSGVSRAMVSKIERGEVQASAVILARLSGALELTLSELIGRAEYAESRIVKREDQLTWVDPESGYVRRSVSPPAARVVEIVEVVLPGGSDVATPASSFAFMNQQLLILNGILHLQQGDAQHVLEPGDCIFLGEPQDCRFMNPSAETIRYLVVLTKKTQD